MRSISGQAARHTGRLLHALAQIAFAVLVVAVVAVGVLSWRLARGPLEVPSLATHLAAAVGADLPAHLRFGTAALAWEGFRDGVDRPLDVRLTDVTATDDAGNTVASVPRADVSLSVGWLLLGRVVPRAIEIHGARLRAVRTADGAVTLDLGGLAPGTGGSGAKAPANGSSTSLLRELARPAAGDQSGERSSRWSQLRRVRISDAAASIVDQQLGATWQVPSLNADLRRRAQGGVEGTAEANLAAGTQTVTLAITAELNSDSHRTHLVGRLSPLVPATLARDVPAAAALAALDAPIGLVGSVDLDPDLRPLHLTIAATMAAGTLHVGRGTMPLLEATANAEGTPDGLQFALSHLTVAPRPDGPRTVIKAHADMVRGSGGEISAAGSLDLDQVAFADLPALWPEGVGGNGARPWITENVTGGIARNGHIEVSIAAPADLSDVTIGKVAGGIDGHDVTVHWLRPVPPIEHAEARLTVANPNSLEITVTAGRQAGGSQGDLQLRGGRVTVSGINAKDQFADITGDITGPVPDLLTLLRHPKVKLLDKSPLKLEDTAGQIAGQVTVTHLPLRDDVTFDSVQIRTDVHVTGLKLAGIAAGRDLDRGAFTIAANPDGLQASGTAELAGIPARMQVDMDFRAGPATQIQEKVNLNGTAEDRQLAALGFGGQGIASGSFGFDVALGLRRDGQGDVAIAADLTQAELRLGQLNFSKAAGQPATLSSHILLSGDTVSSVESLHVEGDGLHIDGAADFANGQPSVLRLRRIVLGPDTNAQGEVHLPTRPGDAWVVRLTGASLDASGEFARTPAASGPPKEPDRKSGPPWLVDARFDRVLVGAGRVAQSVTAHVENDGQVIRRAALSGNTPASSPFKLAVEPQGSGRRLTGETRDAGGLLRLLDVMDTMQGGRMTISGAFDDTRPEHPLSGTAEIDDFRIRNAPVLAKLLQAMTLYGLVDAARGPGLGFTKLVAPFRLADDTLTLSDARAFSASLGMTAKGQIDLARQSVDMQGTIVPAYFFNSLLGNIPLVGKFFSPERGGGVFAATYAVRGKFSDPDVSINPLAALTPGFLRGLFGLF